eukprot:c1061_g1_i2.p1 GENE.c1061_g1_i2~~c1061_g1_i2.p1  ORF type:complete len:131 (-),score=12.36 c1061_g1_i2:230-622(-)
MGASSKRAQTQIMTIKNTNNETPLPTYVNTADSAPTKVSHPAICFAVYVVLVNAGLGAFECWLFHTRHGVFCEKPLAHILLAFIILKALTLFDVVAGHQCKANKKNRKLSSLIGVTSIVLVIVGKNPCKR